MNYFTKRKAVISTLSLCVVSFYAFSASAYDHFGKYSKYITPVDGKSMPSKKFDNSLYLISEDFNATGNVGSLYKMDPKALDLKKDNYTLSDSDPLPCTTVEENGDPSNQLDVVFLADGYVYLENFEADVQEGIDLFKTVAPWSEEVDRINFHYIPQVLDLECWKSTNPTPIGGALSLCSFQATWDAATNCPNDLTIVYSKNLEGGTAVWGWNTVFLDGNDVEWTLHESGHGFGSLGDEYSYHIPYSPIGFPNCALEGTSDETQACEKWSWADSQDPDIGCYRGCGFANLYRPTEENCLMKDAVYDYDLVCYSQIQELLLEFGAQ